MAYAIMRTEKIKTTGAISACEKHNTRERETPNADELLIEENMILIGDPQKSYLDDFKEITKDIKIRKNNVLAIECFMSVSPEADFIKDDELVKQWAKDSIEWLKETFDEKNIVKVHLHRDETTPHLHTFIVPVYNDKLNCKKYLGGTKDRLSQLQTTYHKKVKKYNLERGREGSTAKHKDVKEYYTALNQEVKKELPERNFLENKEKYKDRINQEYKKVLFQNLDKDLKIERLKQFIPPRKSVKQSLKEADKEMENMKILSFLDKFPDVKKQLLSFIQKERAKTPVKRITKNKNKDISR